jgi:hypothetical protein
VRVDRDRIDGTGLARFAEPGGVDAIPFVTGHVDLYDAIERGGLHPGIDVESEIDAIDVCVIDVQEQPAIGGLACAAEKLRLGHLGATRVPVSAHVLNGEG